MASGTCAAAPVTLLGADWVEATPPAYFEVLGTAMAGLALACRKRRGRRRRAGRIFTGFGGFGVQGFELKQRPPFTVQGLAWR